VPPISQLGPDALFEPMTLEKFTESLHKRKTEIKALLLDQVLNYSFITSHTLYFTHLLTCLSFEYIVLLCFPSSYIFTSVGVIIMGAYILYSEFVDFYNNYL